MRTRPSFFISVPSRTALCYFRPFACALAPSFEGNLPPFNVRRDRLWGRERQRNTRRVDVFRRAKGKLSTKLPC
ncbi:MAG: hypothetical protein ACTS5P_01985 [Candidatus Hodgkinia cicadicola]